jgi:hypothetical protein
LQQNPAEGVSRRVDNIAGSMLPIETTALEQPKKSSGTTGMGAEPPFLGINQRSIFLFKSVTALRRPVARFRDVAQLN